MNTTTKPITKTNSMKTAMKELTDYMKTYFHLTDESLEMFDKALEKEKEQIIEAYSWGYSDGVQEPNPNDDYYNQTYKPETI